MTPHSDGASVVSSTASPRKLIASRFNALFASKSSHFTDFYVQLNEPHKQHKPGDSVQGKVVLNVAKPLGVTHVVVCLHGYVQVCRPNTKPKAALRANGTRVATGQGKRWTSEYYGDGYASLFEDEVVLCGEGRLDPRLYHFNFDLEFPRDLKLPSSIDFERGTITYLVSATLTRPTTMAAAITREAKVVFKDDIDVASFGPPNPRIVTLRPVRKTGKKRALQRLASRTSPSVTGSVTELQLQEDTSAAPPPQSAHSSTPTQSLDSNRIPSPSRQSNTSLASSAARVSPPAQPSPSEPRSSRTSQSYRSDRSLLKPGASPTDSNDTITASVQLSKIGCLPGENVSVNISVEHTRQVRSVNGIIVTLYRQARVDAHPNLPIGSTSTGAEAKYEDYYPRSRTGLGGLSLSNAGSSQTWRKDLSQTFAPLFIDPRTMSTNVRASVKVPEDAFPSIRNAPGDMIEFKYYVEVILDIHGKLNQQDLESRRSEMMQAQSKYSVTSQSGNTDGGGDNVVNAWGTGCIDTTLIQRDKNTVTCRCDLVVGTTNSDNRRNKGKQRAINHSGAASPGAQEQFRTPSGSEYAWNSSWRENGVAPEGYGHDSDQGTYDDYYEGYDEQYYDYSGYGYGYGYDPSWPGYHDPSYHADPNAQYSDQYHAYPSHPPPPPHQNYAIPPPDVPDESGLSEKEILRRAEARLLPSAPPVASYSQDDSGNNLAPSAPHIPGEAYTNPLSTRDHATIASHDYVNGAPTSAPSSPPFASHPAATPEDAPSAPSANDLVAVETPDQTLAPPASSASTARARTATGDAATAGEPDDSLPRYER